MPTVWLKALQDVDDFARGTDFLSGSGGPTTEACARLREDFKIGLKLGWQDLSSLPDDAMVVSAFFSGSIAPQRYNRQEMEKIFGVTPMVERPLVAAVRELEDYMGVVFDALIPIEIGGNNTGQALDAAVTLRKPLLDADFAGRAIPEANCITPTMVGKAITPLACVDSYGDRTIIRSTSNTNMAERLGKFIAQAAFGSVGCAGIPLRGEVVKEIAVPGTLSRAFIIGRKLREAQAMGSDPILEVARTVPDTWVVFRGEIKERTWENRDGYMWGEHEVLGVDQFSGQRLKIWFKNENHMSWLNGRPYISSPDVLEVVDVKTGEPLVNTFLEKGQHIGIVGLKRCPQFDSQAGIDAMGPRHWGFDVDFTPIENLVGSWKGDGAGS